VLATIPVAIAQGDRTADLFRRFDANGDGRIGQQEFELKKVEVLFTRASSRSAMLRFEDTLISRAAFDAIDLDGDGVITATDLISAPIFSFETFDADRNGIIDPAEFAAQTDRLAR
jgi:Ca2+-binding EF-hand superfamily protein